MWLVLALSLIYGPYNATVVDVINAETLRLNVAVWPGEDRMITIHVEGLETPSINGACEIEKLMAKEARAVTETIVGRQVRLNDVQQSNNGGKIYAQIRNIRGERLDEALIKSGYARAIVKDESINWCPVKNVAERKSNP